MKKEREDKKINQIQVSIWSRVKKTKKAGLGKKERKRQHKKYRVQSKREDRIKKE